MRAICDFTRIPSLTEAGESFRVPSCFLPIMGKRFIQHVIEYIERLGCSTLEIFISSYADEIEQFVGDGERWGTTVSYHLLKRDESVSARVALLEKRWDEQEYLFCNVEHLPVIEAEDLQAPCSITAAASQGGYDTGWFYGTLAAFTDRDEAAVIPAETYSISSGEVYLESLRKALLEGGRGLIFMGKQAREGIWLGPGTNVHSSATLIPPVYIGGKVSIGSDAIVGPHVELGTGAVIDTDSYITDSSILSGSYIGKNLDIRKSVVNQNQILRADLKSIYTAADQILLSPVEFTETVKRRVSVPLLSRLFAVLLMIVTLPLYLISLIAAGRGKTITIVPIPQQVGADSLSGPATRKMRVLKERQETNGPLYRHLVWRLIPGLWRVAAGQLRFVGIPFKTVEEVDHLDRDWKGVYLQSNPGLISEADVLYREYPDEYMLFASEMLYRVNESWKYNLKLSFRYLRALFRGQEDSR